MAERKGKDSESSVVGRLSKRGEEAMSRVLDELGRNERVADALDRAMSAKGKVDSAGRRALGQIGLAAADELADLRKQIERLEKRLAKLEGTGSAAGSAKRSETKKTPTAKRGTRAKATEEKGSSPAAGRAIGGGTGRGSSAGGSG